MSNTPEPTPALPGNMQPLPKAAFPEDDAPVTLESEHQEVAVEEPVTTGTVLDDSNGAVELTLPTQPEETEQVLEVTEPDLDDTHFYTEEQVAGKVDLARPMFKQAEGKTNWLPGLSFLRTSIKDYSTEGFDNVAAMTNIGDYEWWLMMRDAIDMSYAGEGLMQAVVRNEAHWTQALKGAKTELRARKTIFKRPDAGAGGQVLTGSRATEAFVTGTGIGHPVQIPLWRTGIWVTLRTPSVGYLAEIDRALAFARPQLGMDTSGMLNSNEALLFEEILVDAALKLVTSSSYPIASSPLELKEIISSHDKDQLIWGMALAAYPEGSDVAIPCTDPNCRHIDRVTASLLRMAWVDEGRLSTSQVAHMDRAGTKSVTDEELEKYQGEFLKYEQGYYEYKGRRMNYYVSTLAEYFANGRQWINSINRALVESMGEDETDDNRRATLITSMVNAEQLCRYGHYIRNIEIPTGDDDEPDVINGEDEIRDILKLLAAEPETVNEILLSVDTYINNSVVSLIGYVNVPCSVCGKLHLNRGGEARLILPFNAALGFFTLAQHKMALAGIPTLTNLSTLGIRNFVQQVSETASLASSSQPVA